MNKIFRKIKKVLNFFFLLILHFLDQEIQITSFLIDFVTSIDIILLGLEKLLNNFPSQKQVTDLLHRVIPYVFFVLNFLKISYTLSLKVKEVLIIFSKVIEVLDKTIRSVSFFTSLVTFFRGMIKKLIKYMKEKFFN